MSSGKLPANNSLVCLSATGTCAVHTPSSDSPSNLTPSQLTLTIAKDLGLTQIDIANSNIIALVAT